MDFLEFNKNVIEEFRANEGVCGGPFEGAPMILVTMTGAKSGRELCSPLVYSTDDDDAAVIIASKGGAPNHPNWFHNLVANPACTVEIGTESFPATAVLAEGDDRQRLYDAQAEQMPQFAQYAIDAAPREIPVFRLVRVTSEDGTHGV